MKRRLLLVDGYNVLNAWKGMLAGRPLSDARDALLARLHDYAGASGQKVIVVFDAWQSERQQRTVEENGWITVVYTQKGETADHYIERVCDNLAEEAREGRLRLRVATSDGLEQTIVLGRGAERVSARELLYEMEREKGAMGAHSGAQARAKSTLMERLPENVRQSLERMRRGEQTEESKQ